MRILIATGLYPPDIGGPATYTVFLEKHARELGLELVVVPFGSVRKYPPIVRHIMYLFTLLRKSRGCHFLYALDTISVGVPTRLASMVTRTPYLLRVPGDYAWEQGQQRFGITETLDEFLTHTPKQWQVRVMVKLQAWVAKGARHIIVPSDYMKGVVGAWGVSQNRITRVYSVLKEISTGDTQPAPFNPLTDTFCITTSARLVPWKGIDTLITVVASLKKEGFNVNLNIYGDGVKRKDLEAQVDSLGARPYVTFHGAVTREILGPALKESHAFVLNTSYEGLSHQLIEVMSLGVPIVTTPVGGNVELIHHEKTGLLVPYNNAEALKDAIVRLRQDGGLRTSLSREAKVKVRDFTEEVIVKELRSFFTKLTREYGA